MLPKSTTLPYIETGAEVRGKLRSKHGNGGMRVVGFCTHEVEINYRLVKGVLDRLVKPDGIDRSLSIPC